MVLTADNAEQLRQVFLSMPPGVAESAILAGGALRALFDGTKTKDYDLFFRSADDAEAAVKAFQSRHGCIVDLEASHPTALAYQCGGRLFNIVTFGYGDPGAVIDGFDFRCAQIAAVWDGSEVTLISKPGAIEDAQRKHLELVNNNGDERTAKRIEHYEVDYGYSLAAVPLASAIEERRAAIRLYVKTKPRSGRGGY